MSKELRACTRAEYFAFVQPMKPEQAVDFVREDGSASLYWTKDGAIVARADYPEGSSGISFAAFSDKTSYSIADGKDADKS